MNNYTNTLKRIFSKKTVLISCLCLVTLSCTKPEEEAEFFVPDDITPYLYSQSIKNDLKMYNSIYKDSVPFKKEVLNQDDNLSIQRTISEVTNATNYDFIDPEYYLSKKMKKKGILMPMNPYFDSLREGIA